MVWWRYGLVAIWFGGEMVWWQDGLVATEDGLVARWFGGQMTINLTTALTQSHAIYLKGPSRHTCKR